MNSKKGALWRRKRRVRRKLRGTAERPRLSVFRSSAQIYAQLIDDTASRTIAAVSTLSEGCREKREGKDGKKESARAVGARIAEMAREKGIEKVVFDRGGYCFHGRVKAVAESAREAGLKF